MSQLFEIGYWRVVSSNDQARQARCDATVKIFVKGEEIHVAADGVGPVDALYNALCRALRTSHPEIDELKLVDYVVHAKNSRKGTAARVKVIVEMRRGKKSCIVKSSSVNILEASWDALVKAMTTLVSG